MPELARSPESMNVVVEAEATVQTQHKSRPTDARTSCLYIGSIEHRRHVPVAHDFRYSLFLAYIDLEEVEQTFRYPLFLSTSRCSAVQFRRSDYLGDPSRSLAESVRELIYERTGKALKGPVRLLTHVRCFGFAFNPISLYYCYESDGETLATIVAEVTNTPWGERHCYIIPADATNDDTTLIRHECEKEFHVSPFMEMAMRYRWKIAKPAESLTVRIESHDDTGQIFDATLELKRRELNPLQVTWMLIQFPFMAWKVVVAIYWQAFRLWLKNVPFVPHPIRSRLHSTETVND